MASTMLLTYIHTFPLPDVFPRAQRHVAAFVTEYVGSLSHTAILARSLGIPAIVGLRDARRMLREGELVIIDGEAGHVLATPDDIALAFYRDKRQQQQQYRAGLVRLKGRAAISRDGMRLKQIGRAHV